jgi:hypothetical protein
MTFRISFNYTIDYLNLLTSFFRFKLSKFLSIDRLNVFFLPYWRNIIGVILYTDWFNIHWNLFLSTFVLNIHWNLHIFFSINKAIFFVWILIKLNLLIFFNNCFDLWINFIILFLKIVKRNHLNNLWTIQWVILR